MSTTDPPEGRLCEINILRFPSIHSSYSERQVTPVVTLYQHKRLFEARCQCIMPCMESDQNPNLVARALFDQPPELAAQQLLGCRLLVLDKELHRYVGGEIIETEAYLAAGDEAAHNSRGKTRANASLFDGPGTLYVHQMRQHLLLDLVTQTGELPGSVLIRALRPTHGIEIMIERRQTDDIERLCNGPGNLCKAIGIERNMDSLNIFDNSCPVAILERSHQVDKAIIQTKRIGISKNADAQLRYILRT